MDFINSTALFLQTAVQLGTPILFGTLGGILNEKAGHLNLGVEGMMLMGASFGYLMGYHTASPLLAILCAGLAGLFGALIYAFLTVTLKANQIVTGLSLTVFGTGFSGYLGQTISKFKLPEAISTSLATVKIPLLGDIPLLGTAIFTQSIYVHISLLLAILIYFYIRRTSFGLNLRMVGESPAAADASGVNVSVYKYVHILAGGFLCGLGGAFLSLVFVPSWQENITAGAGWIAVALIIFATWNPIRAIFGAYFFGALRAIGFKLQALDLKLFGRDFDIPAQLLDMIPYIATIVVLIIITFRKKRETQAPHWLGLPYFREER